MADLKIPNHVAIIMDGNGRWATQKGLQRTRGHLAGSKTLENLSVHILNKGIKILSVFAFSTDNFKRKEEEVDYLMNLFIKMFNKVDSYMKNNVKVVFSGRKENLSSKLLKTMNELTEKTKNNTKGILNICLNYGGMEEIIDATKKIIKDVDESKISVNDIDKEMFKNYLYQNLPPIDLMIRTSGEYRISNFMLYSLSYSELYFTNTLFPDFNSQEFDQILLEYNGRDRRFGGIKNETKNN